MRDRSRSHHTASRWNRLTRTLLRGVVLSSFSFATWDAAFADDATKPEVPAGVAQPVKPAKPAKPVKPTKSVKPAQRAESAKPEKPQFVAQAAATAAPAGSTQIDDVVVVARDRQEKLQDVPITVSAVKGSTLDREHDDRIQDISEKIPNFSFLPENPRVSAAVIRGIGGNASNDGSESGVGVILDGVFLTHIGFTWLNLVDIDTVEVARGPQGTLLGKNTTIGALIITTQLPSFARLTSIETTIGDHGHAVLKANTTGPINDVLAYRLTLYREKSSGFVENYFNGDGFLDDNRWGVRGQLLYAPNAEFTDRLIFEHDGSKEFNNFTPAFADPATYANGAARPAAQPGWAASLARFGYTPNYSLNTADYNTQGALTQATTGASNEINYTFNNFKLTSISAWREFYFSPHNDADLTPYSILTQGGYTVNVDQYSQEIRLASPTGQPLEYQVGAYGLDERVSSFRVQTFGSDSGLFFLGSTAANPALNGVSFNQAGAADTLSLAGFGQATWHVTDKAALTLGVRDTEERKSGSDNYYNTGGAAVAGLLASYRTAFTYGSGGATGPGIVSAAQDSNAVSFLINPSYKVNDNILAYASYSQGVKSGAINTGAIGNIPVIIQPEVSRDVELGLKTNWFDGRFILNVNLYHDDVSNFQATAVNTQSTILSAYLQNVGLVRLQGVEVDGRAKALENLWVTYSGAFNDARYVSYPNAPVPIELSNVESHANLSGYQVVGAPRFTANLGLYSEQAAGSVPGLGGITAFEYVSESWRSTVALVSPVSLYGWQPAYALTNIGIGFKTNDEKLSVQVWSRNLFNQQYFYAVAPASAYTPYEAYVGNPRTVGLTVKTIF